VPQNVVTFQVAGYILRPYQLRPSCTHKNSTIPTQALGDALHVLGRELGRDGGRRGFNLVLIVVAIIVIESLGLLLNTLCHCSRGMLSAVHIGIDIEGI